MFSRDFARGPTWPVHPTVDLALNFHKKTLCPEGAENIPLGFQVSDLCF